MSFPGNHPAEPGKTKLHSSSNFILKINEKTNKKIPQNSFQCLCIYKQTKMSRGKTREKLILPLQFFFKRTNGLLFNTYPQLNVNRAKIMIR